MSKFKHFVSIADYSKEELYDIILPGTEEMIPLYRSDKRICLKTWRKLIQFFGEASTRTVGSFKTAAQKLGWLTDEFSSITSSASKGEPLSSTVRTFATQRADAISIRLPWEGAARLAAQILDKTVKVTGDEIYLSSIMNAGDGSNQHPTQAFLDLLTIKRKLGRLNDFKIAILGDQKDGRTAHSLLDALSLQSNISVVSVTAPATKLPDYYKSKFEEFTESSSMQLLEDCDVVYVLRLQSECKDMSQDALADLKKNIPLLQGI